MSNGSPADDASARERGEVVSYRDTHIEHVDWVIPGLIPEGMLSVVAGEQGLGKSLLQCAWAASITQAGGSVLLVSAEDSPTHTIKPRLIAAQANDALVYRAVSHLMLGADDEAWRGIAMLDRWVEELDTRLIVLDPISEYMHASTDTYKEQHVRLVLASLNEIAQRRHCAIIYVMHLTKGMGGTPLQRIAGSGAFTQFARSVLLMTPETTRQERGRLVAHVKCNVAEEHPTQLWEVVPIILPNVNGRDVRTARLEYRSEVEVDKDTLLMQRMDGEEETGALAEAKQFVMSMLATGPAEARIVQKEARAYGIAEKTLRRAREALGVEVEFAGPASRWKLPMQMPNQNENPAHPYGYGQDTPLTRMDTENNPAHRENGQDSLGRIISRQMPRQLDLGTARLDDIAAAYDDADLTSLE